LNRTILYFLLNPFVGFVSAFRNYRQAWAKNAVWLFVVFYGFAMLKSDTVDSSRYVYKLDRVYSSEQNLNNFFSSFYQVDEQGTGSVDIYEPTFIFLTALFTNNGDVLFALFGLVFGYFYSRNIWFLLESIQGREIAQFGWVVLISFGCVIGFWTLGGVRMWTAAHVFFYGVMRYFSGQRSKGWVIAASSILVHFSFLLPVALLLIYIFLKPSRSFLFYLFLMTFFISNLKLEVVRSLIDSYVPEVFVGRANNYANESYAETISEMNEAANWYIVNLNNLLLWAITFIYCLFHFSIKILKQLNFKADRIYGFSLLLLIVANLLSDVPSGIRYMLIAQLFALTVIFFLLFSEIPHQVKRTISFMWPIFVVFIVVSIRVSFDSVTLDTVFSNPFFAIFAMTKIPLIDLIK
jgi:hypothetical protein